MEVLIGKGTGLSKGADCKQGCGGEATKRAHERGGCSLNGAVPAEVGAEVRA